mmetsp:Transcript_11651/g.16663  ORF Transcript_11651/g.16663 Transcript_11651/m.16663 type:complete len:243 (+) Transcript_11651:234-962(+)
MPSKKAVVVRTQDSSDEEFDRRQNKYKFPWESEERYNDTRFHAAERLQPSKTGKGTWERKGYKDDAEKFRKDVRALIDKDHRDKYAPPAADVGHIFAANNGGAHTLNNVYMQESTFNRKIKDSHDELNAALVGYERTRKAMDDSRKHGNLNDGKWKDWTSSAVVELGREEWKSVGVLCKKGGEIDKRCRAYQRGEISVDKHGNTHGLAAKAQEITTRSTRSKSKAASSNVDCLGESFGRLGI